jgi:hypothetical protein
MNKRIWLLAFAMLSIVLMTHAALAQSDLGLKAIGGRLGYVDPEDGYKGTFTIGAVADFGTIIPKLHWDGAVTYWSSDYDWGWYGNAYKVTLTDLAVRSGVKYMFLEGDWQPYAGGGLGLHFFSSDVSGPYSANWTGASDTKFEFYIAGGVSHQLTHNLVGSAELLFDIGDVDQTNIQINIMYLLGK